MNLNEYQNKAWGFALPSAKNNVYVSFGLISEVGEYFGKYAKFIRDGTDAGEMMKARKKELGDILWFIAAEATMNGWKFSDIAGENISKLEERVKAGTIQGSGDNR